MSLKRQSRQVGYVKKRWKAFTPPGCPQIESLAMSLAD